MKLRAIILVAAGIALTAAWTAAPAPVAFHASPTPVPANLVAAHHLAQHRHSSSEYLVDGATLGSAASQKPRTPPAPGDPVVQANTGAWRVCYDSGIQTLYLCSAPDWHMTDDHGFPEWDTLGTGGDQSITLVPSVDFFYVKFSSGNYLCAGGGVGSTDKITTLGGCSNYHEEWDFDTSPIKGGKIIISAVTR
jgi:hypothetical protein